MEPSPVHRTMGYRIACLKNPDIVVPDKHVLGLHVAGDVDPGGLRGTEAEEPFLCLRGFGGALGR